MLSPWLALPRCVASKQLLQTLVCDCGFESLWVLERCLASLALCTDGKSCAEELLFCKVITLCWADAYTLLSWLSVCTPNSSHNVSSKKVLKKKVHLPSEHSTSKVASTCHDDDPHSLVTYGLQGPSCILLIIWLKYFRNRKLNDNKKQKQKIC